MVEQRGKSHTISTKKSIPQSEKFVNGENKKADIKTATNDINQMNTATSAFTYNVAELIKKVKDEKIVENIPKQLRWHDNTNNEAKMYS